MPSKHLSWMANLSCFKKTVVFYDSCLCSGMGYPNKAKQDNSVQQPSFKVYRAK